MADTEQNGEENETPENTKQKIVIEIDNQENISLNASEAKENKEEKNQEIKNEGRTTETKQDTKQEKDPKTEQHGKKIHIDVKSHYKTFNQTTLPHVLTEYGLEDKSHPKPKKKEKVKKKKRRNLFYDNDEDDITLQRKAREEKFRQTYGDNRSVNQHYADYLEFIERKVINQRQKLQKEREEEEKRAKEREEEERMKLKLQRRRETVNLRHDDKYLQSLPKTDLFRIVELQDKMRREGKLKTQSDVDKFWEEITQPDVFYAQFKVNRSADPIKQPHKTDDLSKIPEKPGPRVPLADIPPRSLSHISEASRGTGDQPWAITQQFQSSQKARTPSREKSGKSTRSSKDPLLDLEKRCPKLEMPPLACFSLRLGEKPPDPEEVQRKVDLKAREKNRKKFVRKLRKMHQLAMANAAIANRLLAQRGDLSQILEGATLRDLRNYCCEPKYDEDMAVYDEPESAVRYPAEMTRAIEIYPEEESSTPASSRPSSHKSSTSSHRLTPLGSGTEASSTEGSRRSRKKKLSAEMIEYPTPLPLTYGEVQGAAKVVEAKCLSTNWTNYMHAGKSVFAPT